MEFRTLERRMTWGQFNKGNSLLSIKALWLMLSLSDAQIEKELNQGRAGSRQTSGPCCLDKHCDNTTLFFMCVMTSILCVTLDLEVMQHWTPEPKICNNVPNWKIWTKVMNGCCMDMGHGLPLTPDNLIKDILIWPQKPLVVASLLKLGFSPNWCSVEMFMSCNSERGRRDGRHLEQPLGVTWRDMRHSHAVNN